MENLKKTIVLGVAGYSILPIVQVSLFLLFLGKLLFLLYSCSHVLGEDGVPHRAINITYRADPNATETLEHQIAIYPNNFCESRHPVKHMI